MNWCETVWFGLAQKKKSPSRANQVGAGGHGRGQKDEEEQMANHGAIIQPLRRGDSGSVPWHNPRRPSGEPP